MTLLRYKRYIGSAEVSVEDGVVFGKLLHIRDLVTYEAETIPELQMAFEAAVDDYIQDCLDSGRQPDEPYKGVFNVRVPAVLHRDLAFAAKQSETTLNEYVVRVLSCHSRIEMSPIINVHQNWTMTNTLLHERFHGRVSKLLEPSSQENEATKSTIRSPDAWTVVRSQNKRVLQ